jgi:hypothetical protein
MTLTQIVLSLNWHLQFAKSLKRIDNLDLTTISINLVNLNRVKLWQVEIKLNKIFF